MAAVLPSTATCADLVDLGIVSRESSADLEAYVGLLLRWQQRINLIGPSTIPTIWARHVADSAQLMAHIDPQGECIIDVGSGAGLPGMILAIAMKGRPRGFVHLIESNAKKAAFLREAIRLTDAPAQVLQARIESVDSAALRPQPTIVTARALAPLQNLLELTHGLLEKAAFGLFLKGQDVDIELTETSKYWRIQVETTPSLLEGGGVILKVSEVSREPRSP